ncbi:hypothetical protein PbJCM13498_35980 [Prolixibacter bellariivorans]|uniref:Uncharacterized protein n=1 Tax=Prolixibacter bellariivorans TaxID=314319 RepID=A0A5M4B3K1_9BACT|nr:tetratricopeptide repeat protein [Prolixibacter bellariivorans]GET34735.1 hypothetical protein PbJCM13498_35980 [Prolixibacter bellariivorans]
MKKLIAVLIFTVGFLGTSFAQDNNQDAIASKNAGNEALRSKDYAKAMTNFEKAIANWGDQDPDYVMIYNTGYSAYKIKKWDQAIKYFTMAADASYKAEYAYLYIANSYRHLNNMPKFEETLETGLTKYPNSKKIKSFLGVYYLKEGNAHYKKGAAILQAAANDVKAGKYKTTDDKYKAQVAKAKVDFKAAMPFVEKAVKLDPSDPQAKQLKDLIQKNLDM